jgi:hypothetical protein
MSNEFNSTENDPGWEALIANDPAQHLAKPELDALKGAVLSEATMVAPISKRSWLAPVAVAASVALFVGGGAGYTIAAQSGSNSANSISAPALEMGSAAGLQDGKISTSAVWGGRPFLEAGSGISDNSGTQIGYTFDASDVDRKTQLQLIADVFAVDGEISGSKADGFFVGDENYFKANAQISGASWDFSQLITWSFYDSSASPQYCGEVLPMDDAKSSGDEAVANPDTDIATPEPMPTMVPEPMPTIEPAPTSSECVQPSGDIPSDGSSLALAQEKFSLLGFDSTSANWSVTEGELYKLVTANVLVDGLDTRQSWAMTIGPDGTIVSANGFFAEIVPTAAFDIVGAKTAIERSQDALWAQLSPQELYKDGMVYPMDRGVSQENEMNVKRNSNGQPILDANVDRMTISNAQKSLMPWYLNDGSTILLPAYLLSESDSKDSRQWLQLSIADKYVDFS